jgi:hypothetical protein
MKRERGKERQIILLYWEIHFISIGKGVRRLAKYPPSVIVKISLSSR